MDTSWTQEDVSASATKIAHATTNLIPKIANVSATGDVHIITDLIKANVSVSVTEDVTQDMF